jgi:hypothetical protein
MTPEKTSNNPFRDELRFLRKELPIYLMFYYEWLTEKLYLDSNTADQECLKLTEALIKGGIREAMRIFRQINFAMPENYENDETWNNISATIQRFRDEFS